MMNTLILAVSLTTAAIPVLAAQDPIQEAGSSTVSAASSCSSELSCPSSTSSDVDTCCVNSPGGLLLQTQFWDSNPSLGPADSWTIHGLWPDLCNGGYDQSCDSSRDLTDVKSTLLAASSSASDLVDYMSQYWLSINGDNNDLWAHEWNKHGTCVSTLEPSCYSSLDSTSNKDALDYFTRAVTLYQTRNSYAALAAANIVPSNDRTYTASEIQSALSTLHGAEVTIRCENSEDLNEIWYHFRVRGPLRDAPAFSSSSSAASANDTGIFVATSPASGSKSNCPDSGIRYPPKSSSSSSSSAAAAAAAAASQRSEL